MNRTIKRTIFTLAALIIVLYFVNRFWRVEDGSGGGAIEQLLFQK